MSTSTPSGPGQSVPAHGPSPPARGCQPDGDLQAARRIRPPKVAAGGADGKRLPGRRAAALRVGAEPQSARAGQRLRRRLTDPAQGQRSAPLCYVARGFSLHAATRLAAADRERLEPLCRYVLRPPPAAARRRWLDPQTLVFPLKTPWGDGTSELVVSPHELLERLAALVPPPRRHLSPSARCVMAHGGGPDELDAADRGRCRSLWAWDHPHSPSVPALHGGSGRRAQPQTLGPTPTRVPARALRRGVLAPQRPQDHPRVPPHGPPRTGLPSRHAP
ncbi:MAG: transposase [Candidatus Latescibacterota bacterium]